MTDTATQRVGLTKRISTGLRWRANAARQEIREWRNLPLDLFGGWNRECVWRRLCFAHDSGIGWRFLRNHRARLPHAGGFYLLRTNSIGMRSDREYPEACPVGRKRIVVLGDSYTAGDGVSNGERFSDLLEQRFPNLDVMNFGLPNTGTDQQLLVFEHLARRYEAHAYFMCASVENILRNVVRCRPALEWSTGDICYRAKPYFVPNGDKLDLRNVPVPDERRMASDLGDWQTGYEVVNPDNPYEGYATEDSPSWLLMAAILDRFFQQVAGKPVFLIPLPVDSFIRGQLDPVYLDRFASLSDPDRGIRVIDVLPDFLALSAEDRESCMFKTDPHFSAFGHCVVADVLSRELTAIGPEIAGSQTPFEKGVQAK